MFAGNQQDWDDLNRTMHIEVCSIGVLLQFEINNGKSFKQRTTGILIDNCGDNPWQASKAKESNRSPLNGRTKNLPQIQ